MTTNEERAARGDGVLHAYMGTPAGEPDTSEALHEALVDLLTDFMHMAGGPDAIFIAAQTANQHYTAEALDLDAWEDDEDAN